MFYMQDTRQGIQGRQKENAQEVVEEAAQAGHTEAYTESEKEVMFTDWANPDPRYHYMRGALLGFVAATLLWCHLIPKLRAYLRNRRQPDTPSKGVLRIEYSSFDRSTYTVEDMKHLCRRCGNPLPRTGINIYCNSCKAQDKDEV